VTRHTI